MDSINTITQNLFEQYGNRKEHGRFSIVVDTEHDKAYPVPIDEEHIDYTARLFPEQTIRDGKIVPVDFQIDNNGSMKVEEIRIGQSGMEILKGVRHTRTDLDYATTKAYEIIQNSLDKEHISMNGEVRCNLVTKYLKKNS